MYEDRDRGDHDPRDALMGDLDLPRGEERELVVDRDRVYELNGEDSRTLAAVGTFRVVPALDGSLKASTIAFYAGNLERHVLPLLGTRSVRSVTRADCRELIAVNRAKGLAVNTVKGIARTLSVVLSQAVEDDKLPANPALRLGRYLRRGDEMPTEIHPLTTDEAALLVDVAREDFCLPGGGPSASTG